jgi:hypothetical protein
MKCPRCGQPYETAPLHCSAGGGEPYDMEPDGGSWFTLTEDERSRLVRETQAAITRIKTERKAAQQ